MLPLDQHTYRQLVQAKAGTAIALPYLGTADKPAPLSWPSSRCSATSSRQDMFDAISIKDGMLELRGLPGGDYDLWLKQVGEHIRIRVVTDRLWATMCWASSASWSCRPSSRCKLPSIGTDAKEVTIRLQDMSPFTRVHVFATRYQPAFSPFQYLASVRDAESSGSYPDASRIDLPDRPEYW